VHLSSRTFQSASCRARLLSLDLDILGLVIDNSNWTSETRDESIVPFLLIPSLGGPRGLSKEF
jgi:hypothetical protein